MMLKWLARIFSPRGGGEDKKQLWESETTLRQAILNKEIERNRKTIEEIFDRCGDLIIHELWVEADRPVRCLVFYLDTLVKDDLLQKSLLRSLLDTGGKSSSQSTLDWIREQVLPVARTIETNLWGEVAVNICKGFVGLLVEGQDSVLLIRIPEDISRPVSQPVSQTAVMGPSAAFNENDHTNIGLLRKHLPTAKLAVEELSVGDITKTSVNLVYLKGNAPEGLINEIKARIEHIKVDGILNGGQLEEHIQDSPYSLFSGIDSTERPDRLAAHLLEGGAALIIGGTPYALLMPSTLANQLTSSDDYNNRFWYASLIRFIRWMAFLMAALAPGVYVAVISYHQELIPPSLLVTIVANREGIPFPAFAEALLMELTFEVLREAGVRLPRTFGQTISIVGTIVVGQAAVSAGLVSSGMVVVVAITAIASYSIPSLSLANSVRLLRFFFMAAGAVLGLFGILAGISLFNLHTSSLRSFGVPYLSPLAPLSLGDLKDSFIRLPNWMMKSRPRLTGYMDPQRQATQQKPMSPSIKNGVKTEKRRGKG